MHHKRVRHAKILQSKVICVLLSHTDCVTSLTIELYIHCIDVLFVRFIHRLDYATSGCMCIALTKKAARCGNKAFAKRYVTKHYLALVGAVASHILHFTCIFISYSFADNK